MDLDVQAVTGAIIRIRGINEFAKVDEIWDLIKETRIDMKEFNANMEQSMEQFRVGMEELRRVRKRRTGS